MTDITQSLGPGRMPASSSETLIQWSETSVQSNRRKIQRDSVFFRQNASLDAHATTKEFLGNLAKRKITVTCLQTEWRTFFVITQCVLIGVWRKLTLNISWIKIKNVYLLYFQHLDLVLPGPDSYVILRKQPNISSFLFLTSLYIYAWRNMFYRRVYNEFVLSKHCCMFHFYKLSYNTYNYTLHRHLMFTVIYPPSNENIYSQLNQTGSIFKMFILN